MVSIKFCNLKYILNKNSILSIELLLTVSCTIGTIRYGNWIYLYMERRV